MTTKEVFLTKKSPEYESSAAAQAAGVRYAESYLAAPLHILHDRVNQTQEMLHLAPQEIGFIFLDRDSRPALHAWQTLTHHTHRAIPLVVSRTQFPSLSTAVEQSLHDGFIRNESIQADFAELFDDMYQKSQSAKPWIDSLKRLLQRTLKHHKCVYVVDTGFLGSAPELTRYILQQIRPDLVIKPFVLYGSDYSATERALPNQSEHFKTLEALAPSGTTGYRVTQAGSEQLFTYLRSNSQLETAFMRGVKSFFDQL